MTSRASRAAPNGRRVVVPDFGPLPLARKGGRGGVESVQGTAMGTTWSLKFIAGATTAGAVERLVETLLQRIVAQMSTWDSASDITRYNHAAAGSWHVLPAEFFAVLTRALAVAEQSGGAFDPTAGRLVDLWGFGPPGPLGRRPGQAEIHDAAAASGWRRIEIDAARGAVRQPGGIALDLNAIAKGYAVDYVSEALTEAGIASALVEIGGELRGEGLKGDGMPWWVACESPGSLPAADQLVIALHGAAVATSGDYVRYRDIEGERHAHTIDPRTGSPVRNELTSVTVIAPSCMDADAYATALLVLGQVDGLALANRIGIAARFLAHDGREWLSAALTRMCD